MRSLLSLTFFYKKRGTLVEVSNITFTGMILMLKEVRNVIPKIRNFRKLVKISFLKIFHDNDINNDKFFDKISI